MRVAQSTSEAEAGDINRSINGDSVADLQCDQAADLTVPGGGDDAGAGADLQVPVTAASVLFFSLWFMKIGKTASTASTTSILSEVTDDGRCGRCGPVTASTQRPQRPSASVLGLRVWFLA
jgi:hypothetical protein